ncbi:MAG: hypothetical protein KC656_14705 [Myxococcales bacterium]|nr:hypothetical protein [Myxococcales bacterium]
MPLPIDMERFRPSADTLGYVGAPSAAPLEHLQAGLGIWVNTSDDPVVLLRNGRRVAGPEPDFADGVVDTRTRADLVLSLGWRNRLVFGATLPVTLWQEGFEPSAAGVGTGPIEPVPSGLGDVRFSAKGTVLPWREGRPVALAAQATVSLPTGSVRSFLGDGVPTFGPELVVEASDRSVAKREHRIRAVATLGARFKSADSFHGVSFGSGLTYGAAVGVHPFRPIEAGVELSGAASGARLAQRPLELLPHLRIQPVDVASISAQSR